MRFAWVLVVAVACGDNRLVHVDAASVPDGRADAPPDAPFEATLFDTGLCVDRACTQISADVHPYTPRWALYADGATKRRWFYLPPGAQIDTSDMDHWVFPVGAKLWKEFSAPDGSGNPVRVETRLVQRIGNAGTSADWFYQAYEWNAANDDTTAVPGGALNADGTMHDIPSHDDCTTCHENLAPTRVLGFGALQLDEAAPSAGDTTLADLVAAGTLTAPPAGSGGSGAPFFPMEATGATADALGYLHANCGHCHNPTSAYYAQTTMSLRLEVATVGDTAMTPVYRTAVGQTTFSIVNGHNILVDPGHPELSVMIDRFDMTMSNPAYLSQHMPQLGTKTVDPVGDATLHAWITSIPP